MKFIESLSLPHVERSGFEAPLTHEERTLIEGVHRFARDTLRPVGAALDRMSAADIIRPGSPYWSVYPGFTGLGFDPEFFDSREPAAAARLESLIVEELGWGDAGLTASIGAAGTAARIAWASGRSELIEMVRGKIGCWPVTQPMHGSDLADFDNTERHGCAAPFEPDLVARFRGGEITLSGKSSQWISNAVTAQVACVCCPADYGEGVLSSDGRLNMAVVLVPLDLPGITRSAPLEKLGLLGLPQGALFFDDVKMPRRFAFAEGDKGLAGYLSVVATGGVYISQCNTGLARAAFEHALAFAHAHRQGGVPIIQHQTVRWRLGEMFKKVEAARAMTHRAAQYLWQAPSPHPNVSLMCKAFVTQTAFEVASEALQFFGGRGLSREFPLEKLLRDARAAMIEEGENQFLILKLGGVLTDLYRSGWGRA